MFASDESHCRSVRPARSWHPARPGSKITLRHGMLPALPRLYVIWCVGWGAWGAAMIQEPAILLVEDEPSIRAFMSLFLRDEGYSVVEAADGAAAVRTLDAAPAPLNLVLLDMMIPVVSGLKVLHHLQGLNSPLPV